MAGICTHMFVLVKGYLEVSEQQITCAIKWDLGPLFLALLSFLQSGWFITADMVSIHFRLFS